MRYVATVEMFVHADSDDEALSKMRELCESLSHIDDNHCSITSIVEKKFGSFETREIKIK